MPGDGLSSSISTFLKKTDHFTEEYKHSVREREMSTNREISSIDKVTKDSLNDSYVDSHKTDDS